MNHLLPCSGCARHVRAADSVCPFCGSALPLSVRAPRLPTRRLGRAATFAFGAALAATGCSEAHGTDDGGPVSDAGGGSWAGDAAVYGGPPIEEDAGAQTDAGVDAGGGIAPLYGGPGPIEEDAGAAQTDAGTDAGGGVVPAYGAPAITDGGTETPRDAGGGISPLYGGSPGD